MILDISSPWSLLQNCLPPAANQKLGRCRRAVLVAREVFTRPPRDESFTLNTRLGLVSITQQAPWSDKSKITTQPADRLLADCRVLAVQVAGACRTRFPLTVHQCVACRLPVAGTGCGS
jgi:hypothetical protein